MREKEPETASGGFGGGGGSVTADAGGVASGGKGNAIENMERAARTLLLLLQLEVVVSGVDLRGMRRGRGRRSVECGGWKSRAHGEMEKQC